jgi:TctA family transporter
MTAFLSLASFLAGIVLGYLLASKRRSSLLASKRELSIQFSGSLDLDPSEFSYGWEARQ